VVDETLDKKNKNNNLLFNKTLTDTFGNIRAQSQRPQTSKNNENISNLEKLYEKFVGYRPNKEEIEKLTNKSKENNLFKKSISKNNFNNNDYSNIILNNFMKKDSNKKDIDIKKDIDKDGNNKKSSNLLDKYENVMFRREPIKVFEKSNYYKDISELNKDLNINTNINGNNNINNLINNSRPKTTENRGRNRLYSAIAKRQQEINNKMLDGNIVETNNKNFSFDENNESNIRVTNDKIHTTNDNIENIEINQNNIKLDNNNIISNKIHNDHDNYNNNPNQNFINNLKKEINNQNNLVNQISPTNPILLKHREINKTRAQTTEGGKRGKPSGIEIENLYKNSQDENTLNLQKMKFSPNTIGPNNETNVTLDKNSNSLNE